jgi:hypothetical protein
MLLKLRRLIHFEDATVGQLFINHPGQAMDFLETFTLEDVTRPVGIKVPGQTAIPTGTYRVVINWSKRFNRSMPQLLDVPGFEGVRIHAGNTAEDTHGCILVGDRLQNNTIKAGTSRPAFDRLFIKLKKADEAHEEINLIVMDDDLPPEPAKT